LFGMPLTPSIEAKFRLGYKGGEDYWLSYAAVKELHINFFPDLEINKLGGGIGYNFPSSVFVNGTALTAPPSPNMDNKYVYTGEFTLRSTDGFGISVNGFLSLDGNIVKMDFVHTKILGIEDVLQGYFECDLAATTLTGLVWTPKPLEALSGALSINAPKGSSGLYFGKDKWEIYLGTKTQPLTGKMYFLNMGAYYQIGSKVGYLVGGSVSLNVGGCLVLASLELEQSASAELHIFPTIPPSMTVNVSGYISFGGCLACFKPCEDFGMGIALSGAFPPPSLGGCLSLDFGVETVEPCLNLKDFH